MKLHACHNRQPFRDTQVVQDGWLDGSIGGAPVRVPRMKEIPFRMSRECVYSADAGKIAQLGKLGAHDPACEGCCWKQGGKP